MVWVWVLTWRVGKCSTTQVTGHLFLHPWRVAVSYGLVLPQGTLAVQLDGALRALLLTLLGQGAALYVGQHSTFVGKGLLAPSTGVGLWGVCISILDFFILFIFTLLFIVFLLFLFLLLFLTCGGTVLLFTFSCARQKIRLWQNLQKQNNGTDNNSKLKIHTYLHFGFLVAPATSLQPPPALSAVMRGNWREHPAEQSAAAGGAIPHWAAPPSLCSWAALTLSWDLPPHSTDTQPGTGGHCSAYWGSKETDVEIGFYSSSDII